MFNRVVFGGVGRVMSNPNLDAQVIGQQLQIFFEDIVASTIAAARITQKEN